MDNSIIGKWAPYARTAGAQLGIDPSFVMAQWLYETKGGTNTGTRYNNLAGIKSAANASKGIFDPSDSIHAGYVSLSAFTEDYVRVMNLPYYGDFLKASSRGNVGDSLAALNKSPWAEKDYDFAGFVKYYSQARDVIESSASGGGVVVNAGAAGSGLSSVNTDEVLSFIRNKWYLVAGGLVLMAIVKK